MGYHAADGEFVDVDQDVVLDATTRTATGQSTAIEAKKGTGCFELTVTAASGTTPSMTVTVQTSKDGTGSGVGSWRTVATFTAATTTTAERVSATSLDRYIRVNAVITGTTPSFTYSVKADLK